MLKKFLKHPVSLESIGNGIGGVLTFIFLSIGGLLFAWIKSLVTNIPFQTVLKGIFNSKFRVLWVVIGILLFLIIRLIYQQNSLKWKQRRFIQKNNKVEDDIKGILYKWTPYFKDDGSPSLIDLTIFCTKHEDMLIKLIDFQCPVNNCENSKTIINERITVSFLESLLISRWEKSNNN